MSLTMCNPFFSLLGTHDRLPRSPYSWGTPRLKRLAEVAVRSAEGTEFFVRRQFVLDALEVMYNLRLSVPRRSANGLVRDAKQHVPDDDRANLPRRVCLWAQPRLIQLPKARPTLVLERSFELLDMRAGGPGTLSRARAASSIRVGGAIRPGGAHTGGRARVSPPLGRACFRPARTRLSAPRS